VATKKIAQILVTFTDGRTKELTLDGIKQYMKPTIDRSKVYASKVSKRQRARAQLGRKLTPKAEVCMVEFYVARVAEGRKRGAVKDLSEYWRVTRNHVRTILKKHGAMQPRTKTN
jgi:hypothetical protein